MWFNLTENGSQNISEEIASMLRDNDFIFRIGNPKSTVYDKLQLLILKLLMLLWEHTEDGNEELESMEEKLQLIDDIRHEMAFLRAKYYKRIMRTKTGLKF